MDYSKFRKWEDSSYETMLRMLDRLDLARREPGEVDVDGHEKSLAGLALVPDFVLTRDPFAAGGQGQGQVLGGMG